MENLCRGLDRVGEGEIGGLKWRPRFYEGPAVASVWHARAWVTWTRSALPLRSMGYDVIRLWLQKLSTGVHSYIRKLSRGVVGVMSFWRVGAFHSSKGFTNLFHK